MSRPRRAEPLTPDERRLAIIVAVAPLLVEHGATATTKQMAEAACVAEGTLFSVFPDKRSLILATIKHHMDPTPLRAVLHAAAAQLLLEDQLAYAARHILQLVTEMAVLGNVLHTLPRGDSEGHPQGRPSFMKEWSAAATEGIIALLEPYRERLRLPPSRIAPQFLGLLFASRWSAVEAEQTLSDLEIIDIFLHGVELPHGVELHER